MEMAMPESDMMFEAMLKCRIRMNDTSTARGKVMQISTALRKCIRISKMAIEAIIISSLSVLGDASRWRRGSAGCGRRRARSARLRGRPG